MVRRSWNSFRCITSLHLCGRRCRWLLAPFLRDDVLLELIQRRLKGCELAGVASNGFPMSVLIIIKVNVGEHVLMSSRTLGRSLGVLGLATEPDGALKRLATSEAAFDVADEAVLARDPTSISAEKKLEWTNTPDVCDGATGGEPSTDAAEDASDHDYGVCDDVALVLDLAAVHDWVRDRSDGLSRHQAACALQDGVEQAGVARR